MKTDEQWMARAQELLYPSLEMERAWSNALQLGLAMAAERAELIAKACDGMARNCIEGSGAGCAWEAAAAYARSTIEKPKTREQVLEHALREAQSRAAEIVSGFGEDRQRAREIIDVARRALEWRP